MAHASSSPVSQCTHPQHPSLVSSSLLFSPLTGGGDVRTLMCACMGERERTGKEVLSSLILTVGRSMTSWEEIDQRFIGPTFSLKASLCTHTHTLTLSDVAHVRPVISFASVMITLWPKYTKMSAMFVHLHNQLAKYIICQISCVRLLSVFNVTCSVRGRFTKRKGESMEHWGSLRTTSSPSQEVILQFILANGRDTSYYRQRHRQSPTDTPWGKGSEAKKVVMHFPWLTALSQLMFY